MRVVILFFFLLYCGLSFTQIDFNQYTRLQSYGKVPLDFSVPTPQKIATAPRDHLSDLSRKEKDNFILQVNYAIDELLESGMVSFGDSVSNYIQRIGDRLTHGIPDLEGKLRFYTYNSNDANAFSTDQGMVFVTTGLISQMTSEAQLAFVLAHEIVHYQEKHVLDLYNYEVKNTKLSYNEKVRFFNSYSRENELEADKMGVELFYKAGYDKAEIVKTFDVLIYSYLPFEELAFESSYYNTPQLFVPPSAFDYSKNEISARIKYDDKLQSHPNVAKRKEQLKKEIEKFTDWKTTTAAEKDYFEVIRDICRFEYVLNELYDKNPIAALYGVYVLEKTHSNSIFLNTCKAQAWIELIDFPKTRSNLYGNLRSTNITVFEGQISIFAKGILNMTKLAKSTLGLRVIYDIYQTDTLNSNYKRLYKKAVELVSLNEDFELEKFSKLNFSAAIEKLKTDKIHQDSLLVTDTTTTIIWNKYETISNEKKGLTIDNGIDSALYFLYGISDIISDSSFLKEYEKNQSEIKKKEQEEEDLFLLTDAEQDEHYSLEYEEKLHQDLDSVLMLNPFVYEFMDDERIDYKASEKLEERFISCLKETTRIHGLTVNYLDRTNQQAISTQELNDLSFLMRSVDKAMEDRNDDVFLIDLELLDSIQKRYGTSKVLLFDYQHMYNANITLGSAVIYTILLPVGLVYFPAAILSGNKSQLDAYLFDLKTGEITLKTAFYSNDMSSKKMISLRLDALFNQLKQQKNESY